MDIFLNVRHVLQMYVTLKMTTRIAHSFAILFAASRCCPMSLCSTLSNNSIFNVLQSQAIDLFGIFQQKTVVLL